MSTRLDNSYLLLSLFLVTSIYLSAQDVTIELDCNTGCLNLNIEEAFFPVELEWQRRTNGNWEALPGYPVTLVNNQTAQGNLCQVQNGFYRAVLTDDLCGILELRHDVFLCSCLDVQLVNQTNSSTCEGREPQGDGSDPTESCDGSLEITVNTSSPSTIEWTGPNDFRSSSTSITNLCAGTYTLNVKTAGCGRTFDFDICCCQATGGEPGDEEFPYPLCYGNEPYEGVNVSDWWI